jgi:hypothetical protein
MSALSTRRQTGWSLVKGPVAIIGVLGIAFGIAGLIFGGHSFTTAGIPHGTITGKHWLGIALNGWTNLLFIAAGVLLLLGSSMHWGAKTSAFVVAGVLGAAAIIAVIRGNGIFGIFAANHRTEIIWGVAAVVLVLLSILPRVGGRSRVVREPVGRDDRVRDEPVVRDEPMARRDHAVRGDRDEPVARDDREALVTRDGRAVRDEPVAGDDREALVTRDERGVHDEPVARDETVASERRAREQPAAGDASVAEGP